MLKELTISFCSRLLRGDYNYAAILVKETYGSFVRVRGEAILGTQRYLSKGITINLLAPPTRRFQVHIATFANIFRARIHSSSSSARDGHAKACIPYTHYALAFSPFAVCTVIATIVITSRKSLHSVCSLVSDAPTNVSNVPNFFFQCVHFFANCPLISPMCQLNYSMCPLTESTKCPPKFSQ